MENGITVCKCGSDDCREEVTDRIGYTVTEKVRICNNCGEIVDYWGYGQWEADQTQITQI